MRFGSLFSGIGGFDLGFVRAGISCAWMVERDKAAQAVLRERFPGVPIFDDVTTVGAANLDPVDLVCGGFPCQDVSQAGRRAGLAGSRSGLWWEFRRILEELHPTWCVIENVPGLLSSNGTEDMGAVLWSLGELGYGYAWRVLDAQWLGVAQRRERVFIVGNARDWAGPAEVLLEPEGVPRNPPARGEAGEGVARPLGCPSASGGGFRDDLDHGALVARTLTHGAGGAGGSRQDKQPMVPDVAWCFQERDAKGPDSDTKDGHLVPVASFNPQSAGDCRGLDLERERARALHSSQQVAVVVPFNTTQITSAANYSQPQAGAPCHPLAAGMHAPAVAFQPRVARNGRGAPQDVAFPLTAEAGRTGKGDSAQVVAFSCKDHGADAGDVAPTLRAMPHDESHPNGGGQVAVAFKPSHYTRDKDGAPSEVMPPLSADADKGDQEPVIAVECSDSLTVGANQTTGTRTEVAAHGTGIRRLMPVECERLQGFPDGWTDVPGTSDSARYRQLGNAVAVPVAEWIGRRIVRVAEGVTP